jgi:hypothetical protein
MATLVPWTTFEIGDLEIFAPTLPCLVVHTWYMDGEAESTVTYFWLDEATGLVNHELVFVEPVSFETALAWAQEHAPTRGVERIHVKHGPPARNRGRPAAARQRKKKAAPAKKGVKKGARKGARKKAAKAKKRGRKVSAR